MDVQLQNSATVKNLVIHLSSNLNWKAHIEEKLMQSNRKLYFAGILQWVYKRRSNCKEKGNKNDISMLKKKLENARGEFVFKNCRLGKDRTNKLNLRTTQD